MRSNTLAVLCWAVFASVPAQAQQHAGWRDPSNHRVQLVQVAEGVQLEVLDWGGSGRPLVLLAGYQTAHVYDDFAPELTGFCHVYGITRRGFGASSRPATGYSAQRSADDVLAVLDSLKLTAPVLAGHSFGGQDLSTLGAQHPDRLAGLAYLNSAEDPTLTLADYGVEAVDPRKLPASLRENAPPRQATFEAYREWQLRTHGVAFPEAELRQMYAVEADGTMGRYLGSQSVRDAMFKGLRKPEYSRIRVPVVAFFAFPRPVEDEIQRHKPANAEETAAIRLKHAGDAAIVKRQMKELVGGVPSAWVVELPGANFYIFLSQRAEIIRELRRFVTAPGRPSPE